MYIDHSSADRRLPPGPVAAAAAPEAVSAPRAGDRQALARAHATLAVGCAFIVRHAQHRAQPGKGLPGSSHSRMVGNRLRELDRFLSVLIDETALCLGSLSHEPRSFARLRNTPNKLRLIEAMIGVEGEDDVRLRAIGRIGACLLHCSGSIHAEPSLRRDILLADGDTAGLSFLTDAACRLRLAPRTLVSICQFYGSIGNRLLAEALRRLSDIDSQAC